MSCSFLLIPPKFSTLNSYSKDINSTTLLGFSSFSCLKNRRRSNSNATSISRGRSVSCKCQLTDLAPVTSAAYGVILLGGGLFAFSKSGSKGSLFGGLTGAALMGTACHLLDGSCSELQKPSGTANHGLSQIMDCTAEIDRPKYNIRAIHGETRRWNPTSSMPTVGSILQISSVPRVDGVSDWSVEFTGQEIFAARKLGALQEQELFSINALSRLDSAFGSAEDEKIRANLRGHLLSAVVAVTALLKDGAYFLMQAPETKAIGDSLGFGSAFLFSSVFGIRLAATKKLIPSGLLLVYELVYLPQIFVNTVFMIYMKSVFNPNLYSEFI
ncbi:unnamed protein product [Dovyalis caffra]|uniref:Uncharacterized protein n=1 Tax=Dovyalis caffra TaxID=77055 RepID=A0AAV1SY38_9ROSI|nr:unnamed protein product [Dovyalis caffra]